MAAQPAREGGGGGGLSPRGLHPPAPRNHPPQAAAHTAGLRACRHRGQGRVLPAQRVCVRGERAGWRGPRPVPGGVAGVGGALDGGLARRAPAQLWHRSAQLRRSRGGAPGRCSEVVWDHGPDVQHGQRQPGGEVLPGARPRVHRPDPQRQQPGQRRGLAGCGASALRPRARRRRSGARPTRRQLGARPGAVHRLRAPDIPVRRRRGGLHVRALSRPLHGHLARNGCCASGK